MRTPKYRKITDLDVKPNWEIQKITSFYSIPLKFSQLIGIGGRENKKKTGPSLWGRILAKCQLSSARRKLQFTVIRCPSSLGPPQHQTSYSPKFSLILSWSSSLLQLMIIHKFSPESEYKSLGHFLLSSGSILHRLSLSLLRISPKTPKLLGCLFRGEPPPLSREDQLSSLSLSPRFGSITSSS